MLYKPEYFKIQEFVPKDFYQVNGEQSILAMDERILATMDRIRKHFGTPITINDWHAGGQFSQRGFRTSASVGVTLSQHRFGRAVDFDIRGMPAEEFRQMIRDGRLTDQLSLVSRCENSVAWIHLDVACTTDPGIVFINP